jgi:hypothetical protein
MQNRNFLFYQSKIEVNVGSTKLKVGPKPVKVPFGNVGSGSFSVNFLSSQAGDWPAVLAIHMHFGNIGILWGPEHNLLPLVIKDCTYDKLIALSKETYGVEVSGLKIG